MTRALVTQLVEALESGLAYVENEANQLTTREYKTAITAAREYLATEPSGERAALIELLRDLAPKLLNGRMVAAAADMLEADAQQAKRVPMSQEQLRKLEDETDQASITGNWSRHFAKLIEAHHGIRSAA